MRKGQRLFYSYLFSLFFISCATVPQKLIGGGTYNERVIEAERIIDNPRAFVFKSADEQQLLQAINYFYDPLVSGNAPHIAPDETSLTGVSSFEREALRLRKLREQQIWQENYNQRTTEAATIRQAAIRILALQPNRAIFEAVALKLLDPSPKVRNEALTLMMRGNAHSADIIYNMVANYSLEDNLASLLMNKLYSLKEVGEPYLIELLAHPDDEIALAAARLLRGSYPNYATSLFRRLATSPDPDDRFKAVVGLVLYQNEEALTHFLNLTVALNHDTEKVAERATSLFDNYGQWVIPSLLRALQNHSYPNFTLPMITKIASYRHEGAMSYLYYFFAQNNSALYDQGLDFARSYGSRFLPYAQLMLTHLNPDVRMAALEILPWYQNPQATLATLPLINDRVEKVATAAVVSIRLAIRYSEAILAENFTARADNRSDYFIMQTLTDYGSALILYRNDELNFQNLYYIFSNLTPTQWENYLDRLKSSRLQVNLQALYSLYQAVITYRNESNNLLKIPLIDKAEQLTRLAKEDSRQITTSNNLVNRYLENNLPRLESQQTSRFAFATALSHWQEAVSTSSVRDRDQFLQYKIHLDTLLTQYRAVRAENSAIANAFLSTTGLDMSFLQAFNLLNLRV